MFRLIAPAGTPIRCTDLSKMTANRFSLNDPNFEFCEKLKAVTGAKFCFLFDSGRTAMTCLLKNLAASADPGRDEVLIPAYTCFSVPAAIIRAGLKVRLVDINQDTLDYEPEQLALVNPDRLLAIIGCNLFGILSNMDRLEQLKGDHPITIIDDAAQSLGIRDGDIASGCRGEVGLYSLGRGKNLSAYAGGVLVTDNEQLAKQIKESLDQLPPASKATELTTVLKIMLTGLMLRPAFYWLPASLPFLGLGRTIFDTDFSMSQLSQIQASLGVAIIDRLNELNAGRQNIAAAIAPEAKATGAFSIPGYDQNKPVTNYLRLPLIARDQNLRDETIVRMKQVGITASIMYPTVVDKIDRISEHICNSSDKFPGANLVVNRLLTLPTHGYVTKKDTTKMIELLKRLGQG